MRWRLAAAACVGALVLGGVSWTALAASAPGTARNGSPAGLVLFADASDGSYLAAGTAAARCRHLVDGRSGSGNQANHR
jgi:hypothetical protein